MHSTNHYPMSSLIRASSSLTIHSSQDQRCRRICAEAHLRFLGVKPAFRNQEAPCLFSAAFTEGSSLGVPVNELSIGSIKQTLVDWAV
jgi:hypothetical protein